MNMRPERPGSSRGIGILMNHKIAFTTAEAHKAEIAEVIEAGEAGPRFCNKGYVGLASCERPSGHSDEHRTTGLTGRIIGWEAE